MNTFLKNIVTFLRAHPKTDVAFLIAAIVSFATIALGNVTNAAIWFDEAFSAYLIQFSFSDIAHYTSTDVHPPLYYWALKVWTMIFGNGEFGLRSMSILFAVATMIVVFFLVRKLFGRKAALVSLLFLALSPMFIRYADEARMYTMSAFFVASATLTLVKATESRLRRWWILYGILVGLGMWTHYFTALVWLAHWVWRAFATYSKESSLKEWLKKFFTQNWIIAHVVAIIVFLPWLPFMAKQLNGVQASGFWIGPISIDTPTNYLTNIFYYLEHGQTQSWLALLMIIVVIFIIILILIVFKSLKRSDKSKFILVTSLAWVPPVLLFLASLPPLRSSFVERYLIPSTIFYMVFMAVILVIGTKRWRPILRVLPVLVIAGMMIYGVTNVYKYGNYNKNTNSHIVTREVIEEIQKVGKPGEPIIINSPWTFYEAIPYATAEHPVYFIDADTHYDYGSLDMLKNNDMHKIKDIDAFAKQHTAIWYLGQADSGDLPAYKTSWIKLQTVAYLDPLTGQSHYRATEYNINAE